MHTKNKDIPLRRNHKRIKKTDKKALIVIKLMRFTNVKKNET